jgi:LacI family transcriptional regulator
MPRATNRDVARRAGISGSNVNRALHEPQKVREAAIRAVLDAAEAVGFHGTGSIRQSLSAARPQVRIGILLCSATASSIRIWAA